MIRCPSCENMIATLCEHEPDCLVLPLAKQYAREVIATQDTEPLTPDAARIVELERLCRMQEKLLIEQTTAMRVSTQLLLSQAEVMKAAFEVEIQWSRGTSFSQQDYAILHKLNALAAAVRRFIALQPKG